jgi:hypothetical protein
MDHTREEYEEMVKGPGKFEGEPPWTPYFYDVYLNGGGNYLDDETHEVWVEEDDIKMFPELKDVEKVLVFFSESGFVSSRRIFKGEEN